MKQEFEDLPLVDNEANKRFELKVGEHVAFVEYMKRGEKLALIHTESPAALEGTGAATALIEKVLAKVDKEGTKILPYCPFVAAYIKRHPEWERVVNK